MFQIKSSIDAYTEVLDQPDLCNQFLDLGEPESRYGVAGDFDRGEEPFDIKKREDYVEFVHPSGNTGLCIIDRNLDLWSEK